MATINIVKNHKLKTAKYQINLLTIVETIPFQIRTFKTKTRAGDNRLLEEIC